MRKNKFYDEKMLDKDICNVAAHKAIDLARKQISSSDENCENNTKYTSKEKSFNILMCLVNTLNESLGEIYRYGNEETDVILSCIMHLHCLSEKNLSGIESADDLEEVDDSEFNFVMKCMIEY